MSPIAGASREQPGLFPEVLAGDMAEESPVRCIEAFVASLDLDALGFRRVPPAATGRPAYHPGDLLTRYMDGDRHRIRSGRRLGQATRRNMAPRWLLRPRHPDFETIAAFRQDDVRAFKQVFRGLTVLCKEGGLCGPELVAIDGRKFKAVSSKRRDFTAATRHETRHAIDAKLEQYLHALDATEAAEAEVPQPTVETLRENIRHLRERKGR
jgi:transposase